MTKVLNKLEHAWTSAQLVCILLIAPLIAFRLLILLCMNTCFQLKMLQSHYQLSIWFILSSNYYYYYFFGQSECYSRLHFEAIQDFLWTDIKQKKANTEHLVITIQAERAINIQTASLVSRRKIKRTQYRNIGNTEVRMFSIEFSSGRLYSLVR